MQSTAVLEFHQGVYYARGDLYARASPCIALYIIRQQTQLELDALCHGQPMQPITYQAGDRASILLHRKTSLPQDSSHAADDQEHT